MNRVTVILVVFAPIAVAGCKRKAKVIDAGPSAVADGGAGGGDEPDEADVRAGKRTGMGAPDELPEVDTEPLARALLRGETPWPRVVDAGQGVVELRALPATDSAPAEAAVAHRCGAALDQALAAISGSATAALGDPGLVYDVLCDNVGLAVTIAGVASHAVCTVSSPSGEGLEFDLVCVPDARRGLRLIGVATADATDTPDELRDRFDEELGRYGARCP